MSERKNERESDEFNSLWSNLCHKILCDLVRDALNAETVAMLIGTNLPIEYFN